MLNSWTNVDLAFAMCSAAESHANPRYLRLRDNKLLFNGFWREGDKQNVCIWLNSASWYDAKTGDGGGCKEFAKIAFGMSLPEFMNRFGQAISPIKPSSNLLETKVNNHEKTSNLSVDNIWQCLVKKDQTRLSDPAKDWLEKVRGFKSPNKTLNQGFVNLKNEDIDLFNAKDRNFIKQRLSFGPQLIAPIRGVNSYKVKNLFFRSISEVQKQEKSRLLSGTGGWIDEDGSPRAFGFPNQIHEFPNLLICEGLADYFAAECLLHDEEKFLPLGAPNAAFLPRWAEWLVKSNYKGRVIWVYQLDGNSNGQIQSTEVGQLNATKASKILKTAKIQSELFRWYPFLKQFSDLKKIPKDLADMFDIVRDCQHRLSEAFFITHGRNQDVQ